jgi:hypothetical protein
VSPPVTTKKNAKKNESLKKKNRDTHKNAI